MNKIIQLACIVCGFFIFSSNTFADGHFGVTIPSVIISKDPEQTHAYRAIVWYQPEKFAWGRFNIRFAATAGHWWTNETNYYHTINIYAVAPVFRLYMFNKPHFSPYFEASVGPAYMNKTHFADQKLGIHFTFQDEVTIGALLGQDHGFFAAISALHYSNCSLSVHNSGITVPLILNLGYQFA